MAKARSLSEALDPILSGCSKTDLPLVLAMLERLAADAYRSWSLDVSDPLERAGLEACAATEFQIAEFIESVEPNAESRLETLAPLLPRLRAAYASVTEGLARMEQFQVQAGGEAGGARLLREFADAAGGLVAEQYRDLALAEEANAAFLIALTARGSQ